MRSIIVLAVLVAAVVAIEQYASDNDDFDIEALIANSDELKKFSGCFLDKNECTEVGTDFKKDLKEVFETSCAKCTAAQKHLLKRFIEATKAQLPEDFEAFKKKYDPDSKYFAALEKAIANA